MFFPSCFDATIGIGIIGRNQPSFVQIAPYQGAYKGYSLGLDDDCSLSLANAIYDEQAPIIDPSF
jgi:hypothetical protein